MALLWDLPPHSAPGPELQHLPEETEEAGGEALAPSDGC